MKIYFCDECNESIPLADINSNKITIDQGKIYCDGCAPKSKPATRSLALPLILLGMLLCLGLGMGFMAVWGDAILGRDERRTLAERMDALESASAVRRDALDTRLAALDRDLAATPAPDGSVGKLARSMQGIADNADAIRQLRQAVETLREELRTDVQRQGQRLEDVRTSAESAVGRLDRALSEGLSAEVGGLRGLIEGLSDAQRLMESRMAALEAALREGARATTARASRANADEDALAPEIRAQLETTLTDLRSENAPKRFQAATWFAELVPPIRTRRGEEALVKALDDEVDWVSTAAMASLAHMNAKWAIPAVIEKMKASKEIVREAAVEALEALTGREIDVDVRDDALVLAKVRELEGWWRDNSARLTE